MSIPNPWICQDCGHNVRLCRCWVDWRERALRAEAEVRALREAQGELLDLLDHAPAETLANEIFDYMLWEPGRRGHAAAHRRLLLAGCRYRNRKP